MARFTLGKMLSRGAGRAMGAVKGGPPASAGLQQQRVALCSVCPMLTGDGRCAKCGCNVQAKAGKLNERCPMGKW